MNKDKAKVIIKKFFIMIVISMLIESAIVLYNFTINKLYEKLHFIENESIEIAKENMEIREDDNSYYIKVKNLKDKKIYNISLVLNGENQDVYMRVIINNDSKFMPKENADATKFKTYFVSGITTQEFEITYPKTQIDEDNIQKIIINDNINYMPNISFSITQAMIIFIIILFIYGIIKLYKFSEEKEYRIKKEFVFLGLALIIGITFVFVNAPQVRYDEHAHFWRTYEIASGHFISRTTHELPNSVIGLFKREDGSYPNKEINYETIKEKVSDELNEDESQPFAVGATGSLTPVSYIPQVIGVMIGKILNLSPIIILWLGRLTNLLAYIALVFLAIKIMPLEKWKAIIMLIALFPMSMNLASTLSPDTVILGATLLAIAYAMHLKFEKDKVGIKEISIFGILCMIPTVCKIVYFPLFLLVLLIPKEKFENRTKRIIYYAITGLIVFVPYLILNKLVSLGDYAIAIRTNMMEQCLFTLSDIVRDFNTAINTLYSEFSLYLFEMIGGWNTIELLSIIIFMTLIFVIFFTYEDDKKYTFNKKDKIIGFSIAIIEILGVIAAMYLGWTQAKQTIVEGVQGRYFLPIIPLIAIMIAKNRIKCNIKSKEIKYIIISIIEFIIIIGFSIRTYLP